MHIAALSQLTCHNRNRRCKKDSTLDGIRYSMDKFIRKFGNAHKYEHKTNQHLQGDHCLDTLFSQGKAFQKYDSQRKGRRDPSGNYRITK